MLVRSESFQTKVVRKKSVDSFETDAFSISEKSLLHVEKLIVFL